MLSKIFLYFVTNDLNISALFSKKAAFTHYHPTPVCFPVSQTLITVQLVR